jgi:hypothetical protein
LATGSSFNWNISVASFDMCPHDSDFIWLFTYFLVLQDDIGLCCIFQSP